MTTASNSAILSLLLHAVVSTTLAAQQPRAALASAATSSCVKSPKDAESTKPAALAYSSVIKSERRDTLPDSGPGAVLGIRSIDVDRTGRILLVDSRQRRVTLRDANLQLKATLGGNGEGPGEYKTPSWGSFGPDGKIWLVDMELGRVSVFGADGKFKQTVPRLSLDTRVMLPVADTIAINVGASLSPTGDVIASSSTISGKTRWRAVPLNPLLNEIKFIVDDAWGALGASGTAFVGMNVLPTITKIDIATGTVLCSSQLPSTGWHQLSVRDRPRDQSLNTTRTWIMASSATQGAGVMSTGQVLVAMASGSAKDENDQSWVVLDPSLTPQFRITDVPGRLLKVRNDTIWTHTASDDGKSILIRSVLNPARLH